MLLEKYFEGQTTPEEENALKEFFHGDSVPAHLEEYRPLFVYFSEAGMDVLDDSFEEKILTKMQEPRVKPLLSGTTGRWYAIGIAASLLLLIGTFFTLRYEVFNRKGKNIYTASREQQIAFLQAQDALMIISASLNNGLDVMQPLKMFDKGMEKAQRLRKFDQYQVITINKNNSQSNH